MQDEILGRDVPSIVFLQNKKLMKEMLQDGFANDKQRKEELMRRAQMNEFIYTLMKQNGIALRLDENIGVEFISFSKVRDDLSGGRSAVNLATVNSDSDSDTEE